MPVTATATALIAIADGSEEIETVVVADVLRRAGIKVTLASANRSSTVVKASRDVTLVADSTIAEVAHMRFDLIVLPGGMPGAANLRDSEELVVMLKQQLQTHGWIGAICAAPAVVLHHHGLLRDADRMVSATCHPSFHSVLESAHCLSTERVVVDSNFVTSQAPGTAIEFALKLVELLCGKTRRDEVAGPLVL